MRDDELADFFIQILFAGHDTTLASLQNLLCVLADAPADVEELLEAEVKNVWDGQAELAWHQVQACMRGVCGRFIGEVFRLMPPLPFVLRRVEHDASVGELRVEQGHIIFASIVGQHAKLSERLGAEVSLGHDHASLPSHEYLPFGIGPRRCPGDRFTKMLLTVWVMHLVANHKVEVRRYERRASPWNVKSPQTVKFSRR
mmetsp:Transcript_97706/g.271852  ORF Transcript_97706/g.271852 Transcript_97706/m.271852 type:complete len:200 (-) Transcript_97706:87-686(-)